MLLFYLLVIVVMLGQNHIEGLADGNRDETNE
jgi:hypothetical protein